MKFLDKVGQLRHKSDIIYCCQIVFLFRNTTKRGFVYGWRQNRDTFKATELAELFIVSVMECTAPGTLQLGATVCVWPLSHSYSKQFLCSLHPTILMFDLSIHLNTCASSFFQLHQLINEILSAA
jgi:hypothetical protein